MAYYAVAQLGLTLFGIGKSASAASKSRAAGKLSAELTGLRNKVRIRNFLRNFRAQQASVVAAAGATPGGLESSRTQGALSSQRSQAFTETAFAAEQSELQRRILRKGAQAGQLQLQAGIASTVGNFIASDAGQELFGNKKDGP